MPKYGDTREDGFRWASGQWYSPQAWERRKGSYCSNFVGQKQGLCTAACELLVRADLAQKGFEVTVPVSPTSKHDLHVELPSVGWKGVQVKAAKKRITTGRLVAYRKHPESPILALVHLPNREISYRPGTEVLPPELQE